MTDEQINIAVAEALGWKHIKGDYGGTFVQAGWTSPKGRFYPSDWTRKSETGLPDYPGDLNACHEMEKVLDHAGPYQEQLEQIWGRDEPKGLVSKHAWLWHATARQRCEAFLRTVGKWVEP